MTPNKKLEVKNQNQNLPEVPVTLNLEDARRMLKDLKLKELEQELKIEELKKTNAQLSYKLDTFNGFFGQLPQASLIMEANGTIISANEQCARTLHSSIDFLQGKNFRSYFMPGDQNNFEELLKKPLVKTSLKTEAGETINVNLEISHSVDQKFYYITFYRESELVINETIAHNSQLYQALGESINYGIWVCSPDGRNIYTSESFLKLVGISQEECSNFGWGDFLHPDDREKTISAWKKCVVTGNKWDIEHRFRGIDNAWHHILARGVPIKNQKGEIIYWVGINLDITELKNIQLSLKESEEKYKVLFESMPIGLAISDLSGRIIYGNNKSRSLLGISRAELKKGIELSRWKFVRKEGQEVTPAELPNMKEYYRNHIIENTEIGIVKENNHTTWLNVTTAPMQNTNEILIAFIDITEKVERENQLKLLSDKLKELNATKDKFFSIIAHDLKNPFNSILGFSEMMIKNLPKYSITEIERFIGIIYNTSKNAYNLLENLLNWSRTQTGTIEFIPNLHDLNEIIINNIELVKNYALKKNVKIEFEAVGKYYVEIDKNMIDTVLRNLLTNAIKFSFPGEKITVNVERLENYYKVSIKDYGIGIEEENIDKLFKIGSKFTSYGTNHEKGSGLGLIISKEFIERNKGQIGVKSEFGKGSEFFFTLPQAGRL